MLQNLWKYPLISAPMAGGASTPILAAEVSNAGGLGFLAGGYKTAEGLRKEIEETRRLTTFPFGVNLFVPGENTSVSQELSDYWESIEEEARKVGASAGEPIYDDDGWEAKLAVLQEMAPATVSFTFGCPEKRIIRALQSVGCFIIITVTSREEAEAAVIAGADALCAQGLEAGGHRASFTNRPGKDLPLLELISEIKTRVELPIIGAGGMMNGKDMEAVMSAGAVAVQMGTAFLSCPESGVSPVHKQALTDPRFTETAVTRAFSGRPARGLVNHFLRTYDKMAPSYYPQVHYMTKDMRKAAGDRGNSELMALWAGTGYRKSRELPAGDLTRIIIQEWQEERKK